MPRNQIGWEVLTVSTSSVGFTNANDGKHMMLRVVGGPVRWRADGTAPTSTVGMLAENNLRLEFMDGGDHARGIVKNIRFIRDSSASADATIEVAFFD